MDLPIPADILAARAAIDAGQCSAPTLAELALQRIADPAGEGVRAFTHVLADRAMRLARASSALRAAGLARSLLEGLPVSVKDLFDVAGVPTTAGSIVLAGAAPAARDAGVVQRLLAAGAVLVGKTNMTEFAYTGLGINPHHGTPANPWRRHEQRIPGGSSSGAAVAVADGMCLAGVGSDTGGSCRIPAALCGITGFKPTARRMPAQGMLPLSPALDAVGVLAADVAGCAALDAVLSGSFPASQPTDLRRARFAVPATLVREGMDDAVAAAFQRALQRLADAGATLVELAVPEFDELAQINAEGGFAAAQSWAWHAELIGQRGADYDPRVLSRIERGRDFTARAYITLCERRADWQRRVTDRLAGFDGWLMPTVPRTAPRIAELVADNDLYFQVNALMLRNPSIVNFLDGCAISIPCHATGEAPTGLSLAAPAMADAAVLRWAACIEPIVRCGR